HHRVAMARRLGHDFLDAHVIEYAATRPHPAALEPRAHDARPPRRRVSVSSMLAPRGQDAKLAHALRRVPLFRDAPGRDLLALWRHLVEESVSAGDVICRRGERGERFYIVQSGSFEVRLGTDQAGMLLNRLGPGDCFGELSLLMDAVRSAD